MKKLLLSICVFAFSIQINAQTPNLTWAKGIGGSLSDVGTSIVTDLNGNVYTTGYYSGTMDFDPNVGVTNLNSALANGIFVLKLDALGNFIWAKAMYGNSYANGLAVKTDAIGNIYTTGLYKGNNYQQIKFIKQ